MVDSCCRRRRNALAARPLAAPARRPAEGRPLPRGRYAEPHGQHLHRLRHQRLPAAAQPSAGFSAQLHRPLQRHARRTGPSAALLRLRQRLDKQPLPPCRHLRRRLQVWRKDRHAHPCQKGIFIINHKKWIR